MQDFITWLEANNNNNNIKVVYHDKTGKITFSVNEKRYTYIMDAGYFFNGFFSNWIKYKPGKALNFAKKHGELIEPKLKPDPVKTKMVQRSLFPY